MGDAVWVIVPSLQLITVLPAEMHAVMLLKASPVGCANQGAMGAFSAALVAFVVASVALQAHHSSTDSLFFA